MTPFDGDTRLAPVRLLSEAGSVFATFDSRTRDSGNVAFGVEADGRRWFVKTAGDPAGDAPFRFDDARLALLANARRLANSVTHPVLPRLFGATDSAGGPMLIYEWVAGELVRAPAERRADPASAFQRFPPAARRARRGDRHDPGRSRGHPRRGLDRRRFLRRLDHP